MASDRTGLDDITQKIVDKTVVNKTPEELDAEKPVTISEDQKPAYITKGQYQALLERLDTLEANMKGK